MRTRTPAMQSSHTAPDRAGEGQALPITLSVPAAAAAVGISSRQIYHYIKRGEIRPLRLGGRTLIFYDELRAWLISRRAGQDKRTSAA